MKEKLWLNHIENTMHVSVDVLLEDNSNIQDFYCADVVGNRKFAQNYGGYPRSDIAEINAQVNMQVAQNLLNDLQVFEPSNPNAGLNDAQIMQAHRSKYCQTPAEQVRWLEQQIAYRDAMRDASISSDSNGNVIDFSGDSNPNSNE